jgi:hypothetical protein
VVQGAKADFEPLEVLVAAAVSGDRQAMTALRSQWPKTADSRDGPTRDDWRERGIRVALAAWRAGCGADGPRDPARAVAVLEVIELLFRT